MSQLAFQFSVAHLNSQSWLTLRSLLSASGAKVSQKSFNFFKAPKFCNQFLIVAYIDMLDSLRLHVKMFTTAVRKPISFVDEISRESSRIISTFHAVMREFREPTDAL